MSRLFQERAGERSRRARLSGVSEGKATAILGGELLASITDVLRS
jgi:hypothetical protein